MARRSAGADYTGYNSITIVEPAVSESAMICACVLCVGTDVCMHALN